MKINILLQCVHMTTNSYRYNMVVSMLTQKYDFSGSFSLSIMHKFSLILFLSMFKIKVWDSIIFFLWGTVLYPKYRTMTKSIFFIQGKIKIWKRLFQYLFTKSFPIIELLSVMEKKQCKRERVGCPENGQQLGYIHPVSLRLLPREQGSYKSCAQKSWVITSVREKRDRAKRCVLMCGSKAAWKREFSLAVFTRSSRIHKE